jgi:hypothetical protein
MRSFGLILFLLVAIVSCKKKSEVFTQPPPRFDDAEAQKMIGKTILIGVTYYDHTGKETAQRQWHGTITAATQTRGIVVSLNNDTNPCVLPPDLNGIPRAKPGEYRLRSTGEVIVDPDYLTTWQMKEPDQNEKSKK